MRQKISEISKKIFWNQETKKINILEPRTKKIKYFGTKNKKNFWNQDKKKKKKIKMFRSLHGSILAVLFADPFVSSARSEPDK